jgi:cysteinyl-tRNA synthetase
MRFDAMDLKLYDTLSREKRVFKPLDPANVRMYVCGPTVYDFAHIGNARPVIVFDVLFRLLQHLGKQGVWDNGKGETQVTYVRNITDVDDKINARAAEEYPDLPLNDAIRKVTEATEAQFQADVDALGCLPPTHQPRATEFVLPRSDGRTDMKSLIQKLLDERNAYVAEGTEGKEVLFDVSSMPDYGALSGRKLEDQKAGARIAVDAHKKNPGDFVLWKESGAKEPGWEGEYYEFMPDPRSGYEAEFTMSPENAYELGRNSRRITIHGRPGWHIECSAMSAAFLGNVFDIHGGGLDLIFPHHENEIAQSRCAFHTPVMANYWMHNGFLQVEGQKMSKSLGNFFTIRELLEKWPGEVLRLQMLNTIYHQPIDWTEVATQTAQTEIEDWSHRVTDVFGEFIAESDVSVPVSQGLIEALCEDLNTPEALSFLRQAAKKIGRDSEKAFSFLCDCEFLGLMNRHRLGLLSREFGGDQVTPEIMLKAFDVYQSLRPKMHNRLPGAEEAFREQMSNIGAEVHELKNGGIRLLPKETGSSEIEELIAARAAARSRRDWAESDRIRDELAKMGVVLKDTKDGTTWEVVR